MTISVIVATYNRAELLRECLQYLAIQRFEQGDEIVVVDNGSTDATPEVIEDAKEWCPIPIRHFDEPKPGKSNALARAIEHASGDILAFTDDDVDVEASWLHAIRKEMADETITLIGGPVAPRWEGPAPRWLHAKVSAYGRLTAPIALLNYGTAPADLGVRALLGANLAVRRDALRQVGGFSSYLGKLRGTQLSGEDNDLCRRIQAAGYRARYCPSVRVRHLVPTDRMRIRYYLSWFFWSGISQALLEGRPTRSRRSIAGLPLFLVKRAATSGLGAIAAAAIGNVPEAIERAIDVAFASGYAAARWGVAPGTAPSPSARQ